MSKANMDILRKVSKIAPAAAGINIAKNKEH